MKSITIEPDGWPVDIKECPPGHFMCDDDLCFMTEYRENDGDIIAYCSSGEYFVTRNVKVQPVKIVINQS